VNGDGNPDVIVIPYHRDVSDPAKLGVTVLLGDGKGGFATMPGSPLSLTSCDGPNRIAAGDVNGDGFRDIIVSCALNDKIFMFLGSSNGSFRTFQRQVQTGWSDVAVGDLDGDKKDDIVVSNSSAGTVTILFNK
jgi:FG-GAP-like repeat/FG-GAP repeat